MRGRLWFWFLGLSPGMRVGVAVGVFVAVSIWAVPLAQTVAQLAQGLAVLAIAAFGFWMILTAPFRRGRRW